jgi:hypothetical protein
MVKLKYCIWAGYFFALTKKPEKETNPYAINNLPHGKVIPLINFTMRRTSCAAANCTPPWTVIESDNRQA